MSCCHPPQNANSADHCAPPRRDYLLTGSLTVIVVALAAHIVPVTIPYLSALGAALADLLRVMWWGIVAGILAVGVMQKIPRSYFNVMLGRGDTMGGVVRAAVAGIVLDLCSHGVLMIGAKLYERGASLAQVMTFLIATPWNSLTLTLILIALVGLPWTLVFMAGSVTIALFTGFLCLLLTKRGLIPANPHPVDTPPEGFNIWRDAGQRLKAFRPTRGFFTDIVRDGFVEGRMVLRWLFFGTIVAALIRVFVSDDIMMDHFGPTLAGLALTLLVTTIIEVCSEGSTPIAAEIFNRGAAPGNAFTFLMAGVSTDYTEFLVIREFTKSWKIALTLPLLTVPQILLLGYIMNMAGAG